MRIGASTHPGLVRENNEDCYAIIQGDHNEVLGIMIADGMGGHNSGELASSIATKTLHAFFEEKMLRIVEKTETLEAMIPVGITYANQKILEVSNRSFSHSGMGTTLAMVLFEENEAVVAHIGDSRVYLYREGSLLPLTVDHSYIEELLKSGSITKEEAKTHPQKNVITRAIGCDTSVEADVKRIPWILGDVLLLCTDGLTNMLEDEVIVSILAAAEEPQAICHELIAAANEKGGEDNITIVIAKNVT